MEPSISEHDVLMRHLQSSLAGKRELEQARKHIDDSIARVDGEIATIEGKLKTLQAEAPVPGDVAKEISDMTQAFRDRPARSVIP